MAIPKTYARRRDSSRTGSEGPRRRTGLPIKLMTRSHFPAGLLAVCFAVFLFAGCHRGSISNIAISLNPSAAQQLDSGHMLNVMAILGGDTNNKGVKWSLTLNNNTCSGNGCGTLSNVTTSSVTYTAPDVSSAETFTLTATAIAEPVITTNLTIQVQIAPEFTTTSIKPAASNGVPYQATVSAIDGVAPLTYSVVSGNLPAGLSLNSLTGAIVGTPTFAGPGTSMTSNFSIQVTDFNGAQAAAPLALSITVAAPPALSASTSLPQGFLGGEYSGAIVTTGGVAPLTFQLTGGGLPANLALNGANGKITGLPNAPGTSTFTVLVTDSALPTHQTTTTQGSITISSPSTLQITTTSLPNAATAAGYGALLQAQGGIPPYTWTLTLGQLPAGLTLQTQSDNTGKISGNPILAGISTFTVQVSDSAATPHTQPATYSIVTTSGTNTNSLFSGTYSFLFQGFDSDGPVAVAGTLTTDGVGNITAGDETSSRASGIVTTSTLSGSYSIGLSGADGRGTLHLIATPTVQASFEADFQLILESDGTLRMIENNDTNSNTDTLGTHGAGVLKPVSQGNFGVSNFNGIYAFEFSGQDFNQKRMAIGGVLHADGQSQITPITADQNDVGSLSQLEAPSGQFLYTAAGQRGTATILYTLPGKAQQQLTFAFYFVSSTDIYFVETDVPAITDQFPRLSGEAIQQQTGATFGAQSFAGNSVVTGTGVDGSNSSVMAGLLTVPYDPNNLASKPGCNGVTADASLSYDQNDGGTITSPVTPAAVTCVVASNGRASFASLDPRMAVAYLTGPGQGFILGSDAAVTTGNLELQTPSTFTTSLIEGSYALSATSPGDTNVASIVGQLTSTGNGSIPGVLDEIDPPGKPAHLGQALLVTADSVDPTTGRGTMTSNSVAGFPTNLVFYMLSQTQIRIISLDSNPGKEHPEVIYLNH